MTLLIDIIGPPGVGKSTLAGKVLNCNKKHVTALDYIRVPRIKCIKILLSHLPFFKSLKYKKILGGILYRHPNSGEKEETLKSMPVEWQSFIDFCYLLQRSKRSDNQEMLDTAQRWLIESVHERALIALSEESKQIIIQDEPLTFRLSLFSRTSTSIDEIEEYYNRVPTPDGIIYLFADNQTVLKRYEKRQTETGQTNLRHRNLDRKELIADLNWSSKIAKQGALILEKRGVEMLYLNAEDDLIENVYKVENFLTKVEAIYS